MVSAVVGNGTEGFPLLLPDEKHRATAFALACVKINHSELWQVDSPKLFSLRNYSVCPG